MKLDRPELRAYRRAGRFLTLIIAALIVAGMLGGTMRYLERNDLTLAAAWKRLANTSWKQRQVVGRGGRLAMTPIPTTGIDQPAAVVTGEFLRLRERTTVLVDDSGRFLVFDGNDEILRRGALQGVTGGRLLEYEDGYTRAVSLRGDSGRHSVVLRERGAPGDGMMLLDFAAAKANAFVWPSRYGYPWNHAAAQVARTPDGTEVVILGTRGWFPTCLAADANGRRLWSTPLQLAEEQPGILIGDFLPDPGDEILIPEAEHLIRILDTRGETKVRFRIPDDLAENGWTIKRRASDHAAVLMIAPNGELGSILLSTGELLDEEPLLHTEGSLRWFFPEAHAVPNPDGGYPREFIALHNAQPPQALLFSEEGTVLDSLDLEGVWSMWHESEGVVCILVNVDGKKVPYRIEVLPAP